MQARKFGARPASPYRAVALEPGESGHLVRLAEGQEITASAVLLATGAQYRRLGVEGLSDYEGLSVFYAAGPPEQVLCGASRVAVRDLSEIAQLHGQDGQLEAVTLTNGERLPFSYLFLFFGARPCTDWLDEVIARDEDGFILTGPKIGREDLLETSVPGVYAAGDVRAGSTKRCATAVGEGAMVVQFVHARIAREGAEIRQ
jgi:thioredoxin reductase (NADPH)